MMWIIMVHNPLVSHDDKPGGRIKHVRQFCKGYEAEPFTFVGVAVIRQASVSSAPDRNSARAVVTDVSGSIGISEVLRRTTVTLQSSDKVVPFACAIDSEEGLKIDNFRVEGRPL